MTDLPSGTVTLLFTDIEGSTQLLQRLGDGYARMLDDYRNLLRTIFTAANGYEVDTAGDGFFVSFNRAVDAVGAAVGAQRAIASHGWPEGVAPTTRMGLHTGEPTVTADGYVGLDVHRAARICGAAHGGQVLLSQATQALVAHDLPDGVSLRDLGEHRLRDLQYPEHVFQLVVPDLPADFPPLRTEDSHPGATSRMYPANLPSQPTPFIGREREVQEVRQQMLDPAVRLVTLRGPGGMGKTRLAIEVAGHVLDEFSDGVWFIELAPVSDPGLVGSAIATTLGVKEAGREPLLDSLKAYLHDKQILLVLDNFEHVATAAPLVADLLRAAPVLKVLITSRTVVGIYGEQDFLVPPLSLPDPDHLPPLEQLPQYEAVRLFVERTRAAVADFRLTEANAPAVVAICHRLDGLPLAIELAAARVRLLPPQALLQRLTQRGPGRLDLLTGGARTLPARQQTLRNTIDWSYHLLDPGEQTLFRSLAVFVGGWTLEAAESVAGGGRGAEGQRDRGDDGSGTVAVGIPASPLTPCSLASLPPVLDGLQSLLDKSLIEQAGGVDGEARFRMLETIREYALDQLREHGEEETVRQQHAAYYVEMVEAAVPALGRGPEQIAWHHRLETEHDNVRAALQWALERQEVELGLRLGGVLWPFWMTRGYLSEGRRWLEAFLLMDAPDGRSPSSTQLPASLYIRVLRGAAWLASEQNDYDRAVACFEQSLARARELNDTRRVARILGDLGHVARLQGDHRQAVKLVEESVALAREVGDERTLAFSLGTLGMAAHAEGDDAQAASLLDEALTLTRERGDHISMAWTLADLGQLAKDQGDERRAATLIGEALALFRDLQDRDGIAFTLELFAGLAAQKHDPESARHAMCLFGAAEALREAIGSPLAPFDRPTYDHDLATARAQIDEAVFAAAWAEGRTMSLEQAIAYALEPSSASP